MNKDLYEINIDRLSYSLENDTPIKANEYIEEIISYNKLRNSIETFTYYLNNLNTRSTEGIKEIFGKIWEWFKGICSKIWNWMKRVWKWFVALIKTKTIKYKDVVKWLDAIIPTLENSEVRDKLYDYSKKQTLPCIFKSYSDYYNTFVKKIVSNDISTALLNENAHYIEKRGNVKVTRSYSIKDSFDAKAESILTFLERVKVIFETNGKTNQLNNEISLFNGKDFSSDDYNAIVNYSEHTSLTKMIFEREFGIEFNQDEEETPLNDILGIHMNLNFQEALVIYRELLGSTQIINRSYKVDSDLLGNFDNLFKQVTKKIDEVRSVSAKSVDTINESAMNNLNETIGDINKFIQQWTKYVSNAHNMVSEYIKMKFYMIDHIISAIALICGQTDIAGKMVASKFKNGGEYTKIESDKFVNKFDVTR